MNKNTKIFIVEDELIAAESLTMDLKKLGYQVVGTADSHQKAFKSINETKPDLVLMDIQLKGNDNGINIASELSKNSKIPIIYLTAYGDEKTLNKALETSPYGYLVKPYKIEDLQSTINVALNKFQHISKVEITLAEHQQKLNYLATNDSITQLPNQLSLVENFNGILEYFYQKSNFKGLAKKIKEEQENISQIIPILYVSLDRFPLIRDDLGHDVANFLLKGIAKRLQNSVYLDTFIARLEGDEFALILPPIKTKQVATDLAKILLEKVNKPFMYKNQEIFIDSSIGISFYPLQGEQINQLLRNAQKAIEQIRQIGGNQYQIYSPALHSHNPKQIVLESQLHHALENNEFEIYYQPKVNIKTGKIIGSEALLRWKNKEQGLIAPSVFIPLAEETGLIESIGEWVLETACNQTKLLQKRGFTNLSVSVNLSIRQFNKEDLPQKLTKILSITAFNPNFLDLELTESILISNPSLSQRRLNMLKSLGMKISIDDFGTGYSSLSYIQNFQFDTLKIDRCFVKDIDINHKNAAITKSLIQMSHQLKLHVVAEGVEKESELAFLQQNNCDYFQGYLFSRPIPFNEFEMLLQNKNK